MCLPGLLHSLDDLDFDPNWKCHSVTLLIQHVDFRQSHSSWPLQIIDISAEILLQSQDHGRVSCPMVSRDGGGACVLLDNALQQQHMRTEK